MKIPFCIWILAMVLHCFSSSFSIYWCNDAGYRRCCRRHRRLQWWCWCSIQAHINWFHITGTNHELCACMREYMFLSVCVCAARIHKMIHTHTHNAYIIHHDEKLFIHTKYEHIHYIHILFSFGCYPFLFDYYLLTNIFNIA